MNSRGIGARRSSCARSSVDSCSVLDSRSQWQHPAFYSYPSSFSISYLSRPVHHHHLFHHLPSSYLTQPPTSPSQRAPTLSSHPPSPHPKPATQSPAPPPQQPSASTPPPLLPKIYQKPPSTPKSASPPRATSTSSKPPDCTAPSTRSSIIDTRAWSWRSFRRAASLHGGCWGLR